MAKHDHDDQSIKDVFREARKEEQRSIPSFNDVMGHNLQPAKPPWYTRLFTGPGLKLAMGGVATVLIVAWAASVFNQQNQGNLQPMPMPVEEKADSETPEPAEVRADRLPEVVAPRVEPEKSEPRPRRLVEERRQATPPRSEPAPIERREIQAYNKESDSVVSGEAYAKAKAEYEEDARIALKKGPVVQSDVRKDEPAFAGSQEFRQDLPVEGQFYQETLVLAPGEEKGRGSRDYKSIVGGGVTGSGDTLSDRETEFNTESYAPIRENRFRSVYDHPLSTFSIDVDTASYANVRRYLMNGVMPPPDAVRIEELLNYFEYNDPAPRGRDPFSVNVEVADAPWNPSHRLARIGLKGREIHRGELEGSNLVFLLDVSGSMNSPNKLPLLKQAMGLLVDQLGRQDTVSIVVYAGASGMVLEPTSGSDKAAIRRALERLSAGGGTNGGAGLQLAYDTARRNYLRGGVNRVILATDGDFNLGTTGKGQLLDMIERYAKEDNISLTALGFGMGNYKDDMLEHLADKADGNYAYIDTLAEARKVLVEQVGGTLVTIAKDVKIQVEFNPAEVAAYRLIGYENRMLAKEDFNDDTRDAGEIGAGHSVTALYEIVPAGMGYGEYGSGVDPLKYQKPRTDLKPTREAGSGESFTVKLRYKEPTGTASRLMEVPVTDRGRTLQSASPDFRFASAVAAFGMKLRGSETMADMDWRQIRRLAESGRHNDPGQYRGEFIQLLQRVR